MTRTRLRTLASLGVVAALCAIPHAAAAQDGTSEFAHSDVLLLLDTSGSMARTTVRAPGDDATYGLPVCGTFPASADMSFESTADFTSGPTPADRWAIMVKAFTGKILNPACAAQDRSEEDFIKEFSLGTDPNTGVHPYDKGYYLPFNRIVASDGTNRCTPAPSWDSTVRAKLEANALKWPAKDAPADADVPASVYWRDLSEPFDPGVACPFVPQFDDGIIDRLKSTVRFGLMTFDPKPHRLVGTTPAIGTGLLSSFAPDWDEGVGDMWSYFEGWLSPPGSAAQGWLDDCLPETGTTGWYEVGARNPAAAPWEGRLIGFGDPDAGIDQIIANNDRVQQAILAMRPFGGTPVAGMLADAVYFLTEDPTKPSDVGGADFFGGKADPVVWSNDRTKRGCRQRIAILITDGGPNLDLQPHCDSGTGKCPYKTPQQSAQELYDKNVDLFVVGFSVTVADPSGTTLTCKELMDPADANFRACTELTACTTTSCPANECAYGYCVTSPSDELLAVCCNLDAIANAGSGGTREAYWAESGDDLVATVSSILKFPPAAMTRTQPIFATGNLSASNPMGAIDGARFFSSFDPIADDLYAGHLVRERYSCADTTSPGVATEQTIDEDEGDYFEINLDGDYDKRTIYTVVAEATSGVIESSRSVRPGVALAADDADELGKIGGSMVSGGPLTFTTTVDAEALLGDKDCTSKFDPCCPPIDPAFPPSADACRERYLRLQLGFEDDKEVMTEKYSRTSAFGAMINSTPELVMPPSEHLRDVSYENFQSLFTERPPMIYAATADGQLHAFVVNQTEKKLNELWSFMPPAVLPQIGSQFPTRYAAANRTLLSGPLVIGEVAGTAVVTDGRFLTRSAPDPAVSDSTQWYTILLGTFGSSQGYFALDITNPDPVPDATDPKPVHYANGPRFLWQLTTDEHGNPLFGSRSTRPAIATLFFRMKDTDDPEQHAVAILPGGYGGVPGTTEVAETYSTERVKMGVTPRVSVRGYGLDNSILPESAAKLSLAGARSLTIVRLDTGEVVRTFRRPDAAGDAVYVAADPQAPESLYIAGRVNPARFSAPITGHIVSYPNTAGSVADRAYVGDAEGRLWRIDLSSVDPADWTADIFHDAYPSAGTGAIGFTMNDVSPIETPPIISTDPVGRVTINISTGEQTMLKTGGRNSVWSLTEQREADGKIQVNVNWVLNGTNAKNSGTGGALHFSVDGAGNPTGERVTGPMALFASTLYFTTYDPGTVDPYVCSPGNSYLWGVHYIQAGEVVGTASVNPQDGPMPQLTDPDSTATPPDVVRVIPLTEGGVAFGVGVMQKPSCLDTEDVDDPFLGFGTHKAVKSVNPGSFQLIVQLGANQTTDAKKVNVDEIDLEPPFAGSTIDAWAAILD